VTDRRTQAASDEAQLQELGYAQQLLLTGGVTLYGHGLRFGGPLVTLSEPRRR
jgi:hypothetical protein